MPVIRRYKVGRRGNQHCYIVGKEKLIAYARVAVDWRPAPVCGLECLKIWRDVKLSPSELTREVRKAPSKKFQKPSSSIFGAIRGCCHRQKLDRFNFVLISCVKVQ